MLKIYRRTLHIGTPEHTRRLGYKAEQTPGSAISSILTIPAMLAGAALGALVFSVFFALLLIPLGIVGFRAWRLMKTARRQNAARPEDESLTAEYTVISDKHKP